MRVIAGRLRGRTFAAPRGRETRPTAEKVREALFSVLGDISGSVVLDLYAGSGSMGIEALSRGARHCTFVEATKTAVKVLKQNLNQLSLETHSAVFLGKVESWRRKLGHGSPFDLVLCDPPWTQMAAAERALGNELRPELYKAGVTVAIGHPKSYELELSPATGLSLRQVRVWGDARFSIFTLEDERFDRAT